MAHLGDRARRPRRMLASYTIFVASIFASLTACLLSPPAWAQGFPNRPIKIVVGPSPDVFARIVGEHLQQAWGQPVIVEPRPGAGGKLAAAAVAGADPDGHTLLFATPTYTLNAAMKLASYDLVKEFEAVSNWTDFLRARRTSERARPFCRRARRPGEVAPRWSQLRIRRHRHGPTSRL